MPDNNNPKYTKTILTASTDGQPIVVAATASSGTTIHTAPAGTTTRDEVWLYAVNTHTDAVEITIEWTTTGAANNIVLTIPPDDGLYCIIPGLIVANSGVVRIFAGTASVIFVSGHVNRIENP